MGGHPKGLTTLFFTEFWERFSYYGMRAILTLFMVANVTEGDSDSTSPLQRDLRLLHRRGFLHGHPGRLDRRPAPGPAQCVLYGGILIAMGHYSLAIDSGRPSTPGWC